MLMMTRDNRAWPLWLAIKAISIGAVAFIAAIVLNRLAFPKLNEQLKDLPEVPGAVVFMLEHRALIPALPVPGLALGILALTLPGFRKPLAVIAVLASSLAALAVVGCLLAGMMPLYAVPRDLGLH